MTAKPAKPRTPDQHLIDTVCDVACVLGLLRQRLSRHDDVIDECALAHSAEAICLRALDECNWGVEK